MWITPKDYKIVGEVLGNLRKSAGITQQDLAKGLRKPQSFVSAYESGQRRLDILELTRIVRALGGDPYGVCREILDTLPRPSGSRR